jgi:hypothetical protein
MAVCIVPPRQRIVRDSLRAARAGKPATADLSPKVHRAGTDNPDSTEAAGPRGRSSTPAARIPGPTPRSASEKAMTIQPTKPPSRPAAGSGRLELVTPLPPERLRELLERLRSGFYDRPEVRRAVVESLSE